MAVAGRWRATEADVMEETERAAILHTRQVARLCGSTLAEHTALV